MSSLSARARPALGALGIAALAALPCDAQTFDHRWGGLIHDAFTYDGQNVWLVEDGGRIRHSFNATSANPTWTFQTTPSQVQNTLRRIFFLSDNQTGWAVSEDGYIIETTNGGASWNVLHRMPSKLDPNDFEDLWDVHFFSANEGWVLGLHGIWYTNAGGGPGTWSSAILRDAALQLIEPADIELYALDVVSRPSGILGLASGEPGWILRTIDEVTWQVVFDIEDLCPASCGNPQPGELYGCACLSLCSGAVDFEPWDVEITRHPTDDLALCVGGVGNDCGVIVASLDGGRTWQVEKHECAAFAGLCNALNPAYNPPGVNGVWHLKKFFELYGVSIFHGDNSAIAGGYKGQHVVRDPTVSPAVWRDRSDYNGDPFSTTAAVTLPVFGAATDGGNAITGHGMLTAMGGYIRTTTDGGQSWATTPPPGEPWRIRDVHFTTSTRGWMVSQFYRIARTIDAGATWSPDDTQAGNGQPFLNAITFDSAGGLGVAVGEVDSTLNRPKIFFNATPAQVVWSEPSTVNTVYPSGWVASGGLNEVTWSPSGEFWAAGTQGQIFYSDATLGPDVWYQFLPPGHSSYSQVTDFLIEGVAFAGTGDGLFAGERFATGKVYQYLSSPTPQWIDVALPSGIDIVLDVALDAAGTTAWAVGRNDTTGQGVVVKATRSGAFTQFGAFAAVLTIDPCTVGDGIGSLAPLTEVEIDPGGNAWVAGECGRVWRLASGGTVWQSIKSQTDSHVRGMSFPAADTGFLACHRPSRTGHCIVRVTP